MEEQCSGTVEYSWWNTHSGTMKQRWWNGVVEHWNTDGGTVIVEQCARKVKQCLLNSETVMVEPWNSVVEKWNSMGGTVWWNSFGGTVKQ